MAIASDKEILGRALVEGRAVVTLDADFHTILALENASGPSVIRIRIEGLRGPELAALVQRAMEACRMTLRAGRGSAPVTPAVKSHAVTRTALTAS